MTTRDPRSRAAAFPDPQGAREATQSLSLPPDEAFERMREVEPGDDDGGDDALFGAPDPSHPSLALGTHEAADRDQRTRIESPVGRSKTPPPAARPGTRPPPMPRASTESEPERIGSTLGSYRVSELLGKGGMGYVFRAEHVKLGREVALKLLRSDYAKRRDAVARFFQEARTVNRVRHRNIVDVTDFVELDDGTTFIIMELLSGTSLGKWSRTGVDMPRALAVLVQICDGLAAAHQVGVVHRDLKPDNVIIVPTSDGAELVKLLDFGVAKLLNRDDEDLGVQTAAGSVIGTPAYMSPEQAGGMVVDARSDIYSLGAIMYELFSGQPMFRGRSFGEYVRKHLTEQPVPPRATPAGASIDPRLEALILRCLEKDPNQRFSSILELRDALITQLGGIDPTGMVGLALSGIRGAPTGTASMLQPPPQPMLPMHTVPPANASQVYWTGYTGQPLPHQQATAIAPPPTPWWVWVVGGAVAISLGVGAAVWYAGRTVTPIAPAGSAAPIAEVASQLPDAPAAAATPTPTPTPTPTTGPTIEPIAPVAQPIQLAFRATPNGSVHDSASGPERCHTPCELMIDPGDGRGSDRTFVIRSTGHVDKLVHVDLAGDQRRVEVALEAVPVVDEPRGRPGPPGHPGRPGRKIRPTGRPASTVAKESRPAEQTPTPVAADTPPARDPEPEPEKPKKPDKATKPAKPDKSVDPTDTLDPFRKR